MNIGPPPIPAAPERRISRLTCRRVSIDREKENTRNHGADPKQSVAKSITPRDWKYSFVLALAAGTRVHADHLRQPALTTRSAVPVKEILPRSTTWTGT
jgi:hypothetical protein